MQKVEKAGPASCRQLEKREGRREEGEEAAGRAAREMGACGWSGCIEQPRDFCQGPDPGLEKPMDNEHLR